jgi:hypothetical protein
MCHQTICLTYAFGLVQWVVIQAAAADVVSTATESTATPSSHEAEVTSTDPSPASTTIFSTATATTTATAAAGLCLDKMCQWLLGWLLGLVIASFCACWWRGNANL